MLFFCQIEKAANIKERDRNLELLYESVYQEHFSKYPFVDNMCLRYRLLVALHIGKTYTLDSI